MTKMSVLVSQAMKNEQSKSDSLRYQEGNGYLNDGRLESFGHLLADYVLHGAELTVDSIDNKAIHISEGVISFTDQLWRSFLSSFRANDPNTTYYIGFVIEQGYVFGPTEPAERYMRLWSVKTDATGKLGTAVDFRGPVGKVKYKAIYDGVYLNTAEIQAAIDRAIAVTDDVHAVADQVNAAVFEVQTLISNSVGALEGANEATARATVATTKANTATLAADMAAIEANNAKVGALSAKDAAIVARTEADSATLAAKTATTGAIEARDSANLAATTVIEAKDSAVLAAEAATNAVSAANEAVTSATNAATSAADAVIAANIAKTDAELATTNASAAATTADAATVAANTAAMTANTAAAGADTAISSVNVAKDAANTAAASANTAATSVNDALAGVTEMEVELDGAMDAVAGTVRIINERLLVDVAETLMEFDQGIKHDGLNIFSWGAKGDGVQIDSNSITNALAQTVTGKVKRVKIPDGTYKIDKTIVIPRGVHLELGQKAIIKPTSGNFNIFQLKPEGRLSGGEVDLRDVNFTKAVYYLDAEDVFQFYGQSAVISDMNVLNKVPTVAGNFIGTGILCEAKTNMGFIDNVKFNNLTFINFDKVIHLRVDPILDTMFANDPNAMAWVNANYFFQITAQNFNYGIYLEGDGSVPRDVGGNMFNQCQFQAEATTKAIVYCEGAFNTFDIFLWDLHKMADENPAIQFHKKSKFNKLSSAMQLEISESWSDEGYMNVISSPGNYVPDQRVLAQRISTPFKGQFNGNQDDYLINGHLRGYTVTQTKGPNPTGVLTDIFTPDSEVGPTWAMTPAIDYMNPIVIEIDCSADPIVYAQYMGTVHPWDAIPEGLRLEGYTGTEWIWLNEIKGNRSLDYIITPPYSAVDFLHKIRISFYGSPKTNKKVTIGRVVAISSKNLGKAYIPQFTDALPMVDVNGVKWNIKLNTDGSWNNVPLSSPVTPGIPGEKSMAGDQDDILLLANKKFAFTTTGAVKTSGELANMFSLQRESFCRWTNPTTIAPIVLEIDFGTTPVQYLESIGINFGATEIAKNIKIERVLTSGGAYVQTANVTNNTLATVHLLSKATNVYKIRLTISVSTNANNLVRVTRIFATAGITLPGAFVNTEADNKVYGNLEFGDALKGVIMKSPDGSRWKGSMGDTGALVWTKLL